MRKNQNHKQPWIEDFVDCIIQTDGIFAGILLGCLIMMGTIIVSCFLKGSFSITGMS